MHVFDRRTDRQTEFPSLYRDCILCSAVKSNSPVTFGDVSTMREGISMKFFTTVASVYSSCTVITHSLIYYCFLYTLWNRKRFRSFKRISGKMSESAPTASPLIQTSAGGFLEWRLLISCQCSCCRVLLLIGLWTESVAAACVSRVNIVRVGI